MKRTALYFVLLAVSLLAVCSCRNSSAGLVVMSYNVRLDTPVDEENRWDNRKTATIAMLDDLKPDVFGVQEALPHQVRYISENAPKYRNVGVGREDGVSSGEHMSVFWNDETIEMKEWGTFWLSETPEVPSFGWDAACKRIATWALMKDRRNGKSFFFVNTHLDHVGVEARRNGLRLVVDRISEMNPESLPMVLTGDFNMSPSHPSLSGLNDMMTCTRNVAELTDFRNTFNGWGTVSEDADCVIDYIYMSGFSRVKEYRTVVKTYADKPFISDHYPIISHLLY